MKTGVPAVTAVLMKSDARTRVPTLTSSSQPRIVAPVAAQRLRANRTVSNVAGVPALSVEMCSRVLARGVYENASAWPGRPQAPVYAVAAAVRELLPE